MSTRVSVAMAVYNGEKYLRQQIESILYQLGNDDEIVISVDPSSDGSKAIAEDFAQQDKRIHVIEGPGHGVIRNFESALTAVSGQYIFLADQDDIWLHDKLLTCLSNMVEKNVTAVMHDAVVTDDSLHKIRDSFFEGSYEPGVYHNIKRNRFIGCCMAVKKEVLELALPFPKRLPMHDQWLGLMAKKLGTVIYIDKPLLFYRRHEQTLTGQKKTSFVRKAIWRFNILTSFILRRLGVWRIKNTGD